MLRSCVFSVCFLLFSGTAILADQAPAQLKVPKELLEKRLEPAQKVHKKYLFKYKQNIGLPSELLGWSERWLEAELALARTRDAKVKALRDHLNRTREVERITVALAQVVDAAYGDIATYFRIEAEIRLHTEGVEPQAPKGEKGNAEKK